MKLKKGDKVIVIAGKARGKTGAISRVMPKENKVVVDGVNMVKRFQRALRPGETGQIIDKTLPIHVSNVMLVDPKGGKGTRVRISVEKGVRSRIAVKSGQTIK